LVERGQAHRDSSDVPTIKDLIRVELDRGKSLRDLEVDSGGRVRFQTFQDLSNHPPKQFPKTVDTIRGMAQALQVDETTVVLAYAKGLGVDVSAGSTFALRLPPTVDQLDPQMQNALIALVRAAGKTSADSAEPSLKGRAPNHFDEDSTGGLGAVGRG
jgi:hypothetical protein